MQKGQVSGFLYFINWQYGFKCWEIFMKMNLNLFAANE
jgi:hypothetical protein